MRKEGTRMKKKPDFWISIIALVMAIIALALRVSQYL